MANDAAANAEQELLRYFRRPGLVVERKPAYWADFVSEADRAAEVAIISTIKKHFPDDAILAEESGEETAVNGAQRQWIIDPIDGTSNFVRGLPGWCVSIASKDAEGLSSAVINDVVGSETFSVRRGGPILLNGRHLPQREPATVDLKAGLIASHVGRDPRPGSPRKAHTATAMQGFGHRSIGSAALSLAWTAAGRVDVTYYECPLHEWDLAAGLLLCREARHYAEFLPPSDNDGLHPRVLAGPNYLCEQLLEALGDRA